VIVKVTVEKQMECRLAGETEVLGENLPQRHFCPSQNPTWPDPGLNPGRRGGKPAINRLSYGAAYLESLTNTIVMKQVHSMYYSSWKCSFGTFRKKINIITHKNNLNMFNNINISIKEFQTKISHMMKWYNYKPESC
jgi:hypothetical protein